MIWGEKISTPNVVWRAPSIPVKALGRLRSFVNHFFSRGVFKRRKVALSKFGVRFHSLDSCRETKVSCGKISLWTGISLLRFEDWFIRSCRHDPYKSPVATAQHRPSFMLLLWGL